jgi:hypothetical protein
MQSEPHVRHGDVDPTELIKAAGDDTSAGTTMQRTPLART